MKIYTKQGDDGGTGLVGGLRVAKDDARIEAYGTLDELSATLGIVCVQPGAAPMVGLLQHIQQDLFVMGAQLATPPPATSTSGEICSDDVKRLEHAIDQYEAKLPALRRFILPGGGLTGSHLHLARVVCRRAERRLVSLARNSEVSDRLVPYVNRLSDLLFVLARSANEADGVHDIPWNPRDETDSC